MTDVSVVFITVPNEEEALKIARMLVEKRIAACVNIINNIRSVYRWEGKIEDDSELLLIVKTLNTLIDDVKSAVKELHSYSVPEIIALPILDGSEDYLKWLEEETKQDI
jgi:periplasmic divalent cation tolerance protein